MNVFSQTNFFYTVFLLFFGVGISMAQDEPEYRKVLGYVEPFRKIAMSSSENGLIAGVYVKEGSQVKAGAPIMSLDNRVLEAQVKIATVSATSNASINAATIEQNIASKRYNLLKQKQRSGSAHNTEVNRAQAEYEKAATQLQMAREEQSVARFRVEEIKAQIEKRILRSPIDGTVLEINRDVAESSSISQQSNSDKNPALAKIAQLDKLRLVVNLPADSIGALKEGDKINVLVLQRNSLQADRESSGIKVAGTIEFLSPDIDPASETIRTKIIIENYDRRFRSGSHAYALLPISNPSYSSKNNNQ